MVDESQIPERVFTDALRLLQAGLKAARMHHDHEVYLDKDGDPDGPQLCIRPLQTQEQADQQGVVDDVVGLAIERYQDGTGLAGRPYWCTRFQCYQAVDASDPDVGIFNATELVPEQRHHRPPLRRSAGTDYVYYDYLPHAVKRCIELLVSHYVDQALAIEGERIAFEGGEF